MKECSRSPPLGAFPLFSLYRQKSTHPFLTFYFLILSYFLLPVGAFPLFSCRQKSTHPFLTVLFYLLTFLLSYFLLPGCLSSLLSFLYQRSCLSRSVFAGWRLAWVLGRMVVDLRPMDNAPQHGDGSTVQAQRKGMNATQTRSSQNMVRLLGQRRQVQASSAQCYN